MKKNQVYLIIGGLIAAVCVIIGLVFYANSLRINVNGYDETAYIEADRNNGQIADHIKGSPDAPVIVIEYADYQCPGCATMNPRLNSLVEEYDGQLAIIYRSYVLSYHPNGPSSALAANAAGLQGYWKEFADLLFANQADWEYSSGHDRTELFKTYFISASKEQGDVDKFISDLSSSAVRRKLNFDIALANKIDLSGTPALYLDGEKIDFSSAGTAEAFADLMHGVVNSALEAKGLEPKVK